MMIENKITKMMMWDVKEERNENDDVTCKRRKEVKMIMGE
jgi:hypothetical protein